MSSVTRRASRSIENDVQMDSVRPKGVTDDGPSTSSGTSSGKHGLPEYLGEGEDSGSGTDGKAQEPKTVDLLQNKKRRYFQYVKTKEFWFVLLLGQVLSVCITGTNTLSELLAGEGTNIPAFQSLFNYVLLNLIYTTYTIYKYGWKRWFQLLYKDGWRYFILAFCDVEGNYFTVLAYRYTTILSCQLINFWAIAVVVLISVVVLGVRYHIMQYLGILICIAGLGIMLGSDHITGGSQGGGSVKGDMWALGGATFYGLSNVFEEFLVSKRPFYEVVGQLAFWGMFINGTQAGIFDRGAFRTATWNSAVGGYLTGYTLVLTTFYTLAPLMYRLASAAFFNLSLLTGNFWGVIVGIKIFQLHVHWMYPIALVLIIIGHVVYFCTESVLGEAHKPWLGENQERGVSGVGTARRQKEQGGLLGLGIWGNRFEGLQRRQSIIAGHEGAGVV